MSAIEIFDWPIFQNGNDHETFQTEVESKEFLLNGSMIPSNVG